MRIDYRGRGIGQVRNASGNVQRATCKLLDIYSEIAKKVFESKVIAR